MTWIFCKNNWSKTLIPAWNRSSNILLPPICSCHRLLCSMTKLKEHSREICCTEPKYESTWFGASLYFRDLPLRIVWSAIFWRQSKGKNEGLTVRWSPLVGCILKQKIPPAELNRVSNPCSTNKNTKTKTSTPYSPYQASVNPTR